MISSPRDPLSPCILVVDDDAALRRVIARILTEEGYRVLTAANGEEALAMASPLAGHLPLVITDVQMPVMNGLELAAHLNRLRPPPKLLFMSGYSAPHVEVNGSFLAKPFSPDILASRVRQLLAVPNGLTEVSGGGG